MRLPASILAGPTRVVPIALIALAGAAPRTDPPPAGLPAIVFVSRRPVPDSRSAIPGLGPHQRAVVTGGRLLVREPDGRLREPLPPGAFFDVSDPAVSPDARRMAFAGVTHPDSAWRIWVARLDGSDLRQVTFTDQAADAHFGRFDDLDPCWIADSVLCFASTRYPQRAQYADLPVTNLFELLVSRDAPHAPVRITAERNGAEEPAMDWRRGEIVFARWWFNAHRAANTPSGLAGDPRDAIPADSVNLWQPMAVTPWLHREHLAGGDLRTRRGSMGYQPAPLADGSIAAVFAANLGLSPEPGGTGVHRLRGIGPSLRLAGAIVAGRADDVYGASGGLAAPSACAPAGLRDGRVIFSYSPGARGDFGIYVMNADGSRLTRVIDLPGTLELDASPVERHRTAATETMPRGDEFEYAFPNSNGVIRPPLNRNPLSPVSIIGLGLNPTLLDRPAATPEWGRRRTFRFHDLDVFADGPKGSPTQGAAARTPGARLRFFATLTRPDRAPGDTAVLMREVPVGPGGEVDQAGLPADTPLFEQLVDAEGRVLIGAHGPAHVAGMNAGVAGLSTRCVGCHLGHSTLPVPATSHRGARLRP